MQPQEQYDFIMSPGQAPAKKTLLPGTGSSKKQRILIAGGGAVLLIIIIVVVASLLSGSGGGNTEDLVVAAQQQTELIRIADIGIAKARGSEAKNIAITTKLALTTEQQPLIKLIKGQGRKLEPKDLSATKDIKTDAALTTADQNNKFDEVFVTTLQISITNYQNALKKAYDGTGNKKVKQALSDTYNQAKVLFPPGE